MQEERRRYEVEGQWLAAQVRPSPHRPIAAFNCRGRTVRRRVGRHGNAALHSCGHFSQPLLVLKLGPAKLTSSLPTMLIEWLFCQSKHSCYNFCKKCTQKIVCPTTDFSWTWLIFQLANQLFYQKLLLWTFYQDQMYIFEISLKIMIFDTPFSIFEEKKFHLLEGTMNIL